MEAKNSNGNCKHLTKRQRVQPCRPVKWQEVIGCGRRKPAQTLAATLRNETQCGCHCLMHGLRVTPEMPATLTRYMKRQMEQGKQMNCLYGIDFYAEKGAEKACATQDVEGELNKLRNLLQQPQQQEQLRLQLERLMVFNMQQLAKIFEASFLCGMFDVAELQQLRGLLPLQQLGSERQQPLTNFYRRLTAELQNFRYDLCLPQHLKYLQQYLRLPEVQPKPQARRLLNASMEYMSQLPQSQLDELLNNFSPAQLQHLLQHLSCSHIQLPHRQQQRLHQTARGVLRGKSMWQVPQYNAKALKLVLGTPVDEPMTLLHRRYLQCLLDHLLYMSKAEQFKYLQHLDLSNLIVRRFRLILHNPALLCDPLQLKQLYFNLKRLTQFSSAN